MGGEVHGPIPYSLLSLKSLAGPCSCPWAMPLFLGLAAAARSSRARKQRSKVQELTSSCKSEIKSHRFLRAQAGRFSSSKITLHTKHYTSQIGTVLGTPVFCSSSAT